MILNRPAWANLVTPRGVKDKPIHRWFVFPHSFTDELVTDLIAEWRMGPEDRILDPFVGAGTTLVAARSRGIDADGVDLSPLAVRISNVKVRRYDPVHLDKQWLALRRGIAGPFSGQSLAYPPFMRRALPGMLLARFHAIKTRIENSPLTAHERDFFLLALLSLLSKYSRAVPTGGWLTWVSKRTKSNSVSKAMDERVRLMLSDLAKAKGDGRQRAMVADARRLPFEDASFSAVITSPPYLNRHDYTRVFAPELMFGFLDWNGLRRLRYQSFQSHPESRPKRPDMHGYVEPSRLTRVVGKVESVRADRRIAPMIRGYFKDLYLSLREMKRVCRTGARLAVVIGNVQYYGEPIPVDEFAAELGETVGLTCETIIAARYRGNSAQQMGAFGRRPSRESVVLFRRPR